MPSIRRITFVALAPLLATSACGPDQSEELARLRARVAELEAMVGPPPASLDRFYPPQAERPVYLDRMHALSTALTAIGVDLAEQDLEYVPGAFAEFRDEYVAISAMVPEWTDGYPIEPVDQLGAALEAGDPDATAEAFQAVGAVCHSCHVTNLPKAYFRYRFGDFMALRLTEPASGRELRYPELMQEIEVALIGAVVDVMQGQPERAREHYATFRARFELLGTVCAACHTTERRYFVDADVWGKIDALGTALAHAQPDPQVVQHTVQEISEESCGKCHLVHAPSAMTRMHWDEMGEPATR
jgi:cytochrome c556